MKKTLINNKYELWLPEHRAKRPEWETGWEVERIEHMLSNLEKGDLVIDIGAEEGDISALLAQKTGKIILFEPNDLVWPNIKAIWEANKLPDPEMIFVGFASSADRYEAKDVMRGKWPESAYGELIGNHGFKELSAPGNISQLKIDTMLYSDFDIAPPVRLITMDVEGSEFEVLKGAEQTLRKYKPKVFVSIHPEFMFRLHNQYSGELFHFMWDLGYKHKILDFDHEWHTMFYHDQEN